MNDLSMSPPPSQALDRPLVAGLLAGGLSGVALYWRGVRDTGHPAAPFNAVSHWLWPQAALREDDASARFTATGFAVHMLSAQLWSLVYDAVRRLRRRPNADNAITDAAAVTAVAAMVDFKVVPERLTPGFEHRLTKSSLVLVYAAFAAGLALGGMAALRRR